MILVLLVISIVSLILADVFYKRNRWDTEVQYWVSIAAIAIFTIWSAVLLYNIGTARTIDKRIELYRESNQQIEETIDLVVQEHMDFEAETFDKLKGKDSVDFITFYPELSSSELVQEQIKLYKENKSQILHLEEKKINIAKHKWLLYFGS